jgi:hypothetical protein
MSSDGSTGRRDGFDRWVATMKNEHQPMQAESAPLKPNLHPKLELDLDENATHVHRIPKEIINRMREQRELEKQSAKPQRAPEPRAPEPRAPEAPAPNPRALDQKTLEQQAFGQFDDSSDDETDSALGGLSDDRTAVFRPPPELLARAKRMKPPSKPNPQSELPTKPPPAPGASSSVPVTGKARSPGSMPALDDPFVSSVPAPRSPPPAHHHVPLSQLADRGGSGAALAEQRISAPEVERSAVFTSSEPTSGVVSSEPTSGVVSLDTPEEPAAGAAPSSEPEQRVIQPISNDALLAASMASLSSEANAPLAADAANSAEEEAPAPTTTAPLVRSERSVAPDAPRVAPSRWAIWAVALLAAAALVFWRLRHGF